MTYKQFDNFSKITLEQLPQIKNIIVAKDDKVIESYPHQEFDGQNLVSVFPSFPSELDGVKTMNAQFPASGGGIILISVPFDSFVDPIIFSNNFKMIMFSPYHPDQELYELEVRNGQIQTVDVVFSDKEKQNSLVISKQTGLLGHNLKIQYLLKYQIWDEVFEPQTDLLQYAILISGLALSVIIPWLLARNQRLANIVKTQSAQLKKTNEELLRTDKAKDEFSAMLAHELKTPLVPIQGYADILLSGHLGDLNNNQKERLQVIKESAASLLKLVMDILEVHKLELGQLKIVMQENDIKSTVDKSVSAMKPFASEKSVDLVNRVSEHNFANYDDERIKQVITNLVRNAVNACDPQKGRIEIFAEGSNEGITVSVKDNGKGIPKEAKDKIFRKFYQVDTSSTRDAGGTGLGLVICKGIVEAHGGKMWFESEESKGTTFYFSIPKKK